MLEMTKTPVTMTFEQALTNFRNEVNLKFPPEMSGNTRTRCIHETQQHGRGRGRSRGRGVMDDMVEVTAVAVAVDMAVVVVDAAKGIKNAADKTASSSPLQIGVP